MQLRAHDDGTRFSLSMGVVAGTFLLSLFTHFLCRDIGTEILLIALYVSVASMGFAIWLLAWIYDHDEGSRDL